MPQYIEQLKEAGTGTMPAKSEIAIVDDDPSFSFMLKDYLASSLNLKSDLFSSGVDFLKNYNVNDNRKIILDYEFNKGPDGLEVLKKIKTIHPLAVVIIVSAQDDMEKAIETLRSGATDYFLKTTKTVFTKHHVFAE